LSAVELSGRVLQVVPQHIPEPASLVSQGATEAQFYGALSNFYFQNPALFASFDSVAAANAIDTEVWKPMAALGELSRVTGR
jgi:hypothetical protein